MTLPGAYFDRMYATSADPWGFRTRYYEQRKRALTVAALPRERYTRAFEPGCSIGLLTAALARRCQALLATDVSDVALTSARAELADQPHVDLRCLAVPEQWPDGTFDLVVVSELGYYLDEPDLATLVDRAAGSLEPGGTLLACHWRHPVTDYPLTGDRVHEVVREVGGAELVPVLRHDEEDFLLEAWTRGPAPSPARLAGLV